ncbi:MFS transporter [Defluviimonas sp. WL0002]|uniref:MFS transporter n=1 Tax=Albidovulum marisflavi TaxID=2984159 RepID=A0ABT2ZGW0_9RHOB|nr:MFS transporter [Defluviimonas sp. WL0002]MCV2870262.1 MFS transporter [Defluviimonas sp. WL0002]
MTTRCSTGPIGHGTLLQVSVFAAMLASAGLPLYIHLPRFAVGELGISLSALGLVLIAMRVFDFIQDPLIGRMIDRLPRQRGAFAAAASGGLALGFVMLFATEPWFDRVLWLIIALAILFTAFSTATILVYGQGVALAGPAQGSAHFGIAGFREAGIVFGVVLAAVTPGLLGIAYGEDIAYRLFGLGLGVFCLLAWAATRGLWKHERSPVQPLSLTSLRQAGSIGLLLLGFLNALPVALTSTLFLFFVEDRLEAPDLSGAFLVLFFAAAGFSAPAWAALVSRFGARPVLLSGMGLAVLAFAGTATLGPGESGAFVVICIASGAALGADMVILPALFSRSLSDAGLPAGQAFGLWALVSKLALAGAAAIALPLLELRGYLPGQTNGGSALQALTFAYAILPCLFKIGVIGYVLIVPLPGDQT